jgi:RNA polymerase sigma-70 factor (ECF subfamily)
MTEDRAKPAARPLPDARDKSEDLLKRVQAGDSRAFDELFARYLPRLRRWATRRLPTRARDAMDTEDVVQDTIVHAFRHIHRFEPRRDGALIGYLRRALVNRIRDHFRSAARSPGVVPLDDEQANTGDESPLDLTIGREDRERYQRALARLRPADRCAIIARLELDYSYQQLALVLSKPTPGAARLAVRRALLRLAEEMERG